MSDESELRLVAAVASVVREHGVAVLSDPARFADLLGRSPGVTPTDLATTGHLVQAVRSGAAGRLADLVPLSAYDYRQLEAWLVASAVDPGAATVLLQALWPIGSPPPPPATVSTAPVSVADDTLMWDFAPTGEFHEAPEKRPRPLVPLAIGVAVAALLGVGAWLVLSGDDDGGTTTTAEGDEPEDEGDEDPASDDPGDGDDSSGGASDEGSDDDVTVDDLDAGTTTAAPTTDAPTTAPPTTGPDDPTTAVPALGPARPEVFGGDGILRLGTLLPQTGDLAFLGPAMIDSVRIAAADINAAGGVFGTPVELIETDSGDASTTFAVSNADWLATQDVDAIVGPPNSSLARQVFDRVVGQGTILFSPSASAPDLAPLDPAGLFFRTAAADPIQGHLVAERMVAEGRVNAAAVFRDDAYGRPIAEAFLARFAQLTGVATPPANAIAYIADGDVNSETMADLIVASGADSVFLAGFEETAGIAASMVARALGPGVIDYWASDGGFSAGLPNGTRVVAPAVDPASIAVLTARLDTEGGVPTEGQTAYAAESYDSVVILALAAELAGADDPVAVAAQISGVTTGGTPCTSFAACARLARAGRDIDYAGFGGPYEFVDAGEPGVASFRIGTFEGAPEPNPAYDVYFFNQPMPQG